MSNRRVGFSTLLLAVFLAWAGAGNSADTQSPTVVVTLKDGRALTGQLSPSRLTFRTSLDNVGVSAEKIVAYAGDTLEIAGNGTVKGALIGGELPVVTPSQGEVRLAATDIVSIPPPEMAATSIPVSGQASGPSNPGASTAGMIWSLQVREGLSADRVVESIKSLATSRSLFFVGESPVYKQIQAITGEPYRYVNILSFTDVPTVKLLLEYASSYDYLLYIPYRVAIVEDRVGRLWLHGPNPKGMNYVSTAVPSSLREAVGRLQESIKAIMEGAATGEF